MIILTHESSKPITWFNSQILITKNMRKKEFNYFARLVINVNKNLRNHAQNINSGL
jgi:hypothetical protein